MSAALEGKRFPGCNLRRQFNIFFNPNIKIKVKSK